MAVEPTDAFDEEVRESTRTLLRTVCPVLTATYPFWVFFDWWVQPDLFEPFTAMRAAGLVGGIASLWWGARGSRPDWGLALWFWTIAAPVAGMLPFVEGDVLVHYSVGYTIFAIGSGVLGTWPSRQRLLVDGGLASMAALGLLLRSMPAEPQNWAMSIGYLATIHLLARLIGQTRYDAAWGEYRARTSLEAEKQQTERLRAEAVADRARIAEAHAQLRIRDEQKTNFFQNISHELRTPLTLILAPLESALARSADPDLEVAARNGRRMLRLVNQLLEFQKLSVGRRVFRPVAIDGRSFVAGAHELVRQTAASRSLQVRLALADDVPPVLADPDALEKALFNFVSNAIKFTPAGGTVTLRLDELDGRVRFTVEDTGPGLSPEEQAVLFELFSQVDSATTRDFEGTGLGLALVKQLVEGMGGEVGVRSGKGVGSSFWFALPAADQPVESVVAPQGHGWLLADSEVAPAGLESSQGDALGATVLVVDDLPDMRRLVGGMLAELGYRVVEACDGREALQIIERSPPELVVTDWMMPTMSGIELVEALRSDPQTRSIPTVVLTAKSDPESRVVGLESGADAFVGKPFDRRELQSAVRNLLALKQREGQLDVARRRAEQADQSKSVFLANMSHELRTPLTVILGHVELLREENDLAPDMDEDLARVESSARYLLQLICDILDLSKVAAGQLHVDRSALDVTEILEELRRPAEALCTNNRNRFVGQWPEELPLEGDAIRIRQVLLNLISNAAKFTREGEVTMTAGADGDEVWIRVSDTGIGMDETQQARLFQPFVQVHGHGHARFGGTGLGLSLSRQLTHMMGGEVTVSSVKGEGSTFTVRLRAAPSVSQAV